MKSASKVLEDKKGNCFEISNLACSLLLGAGYDAYMCSGYASKEICYDDRANSEFQEDLEKIQIESTLHCNIFDEYPGYSKLTEHLAHYMPHMKEYSDDEISYQSNKFKSKYLEEMERRRKNVQKKSNEIQESVENNMDPLNGVRVHCWILVKEGKREVPESFFIDPISGRCFNLDFSKIYGLESCWNERNVWLNMQSCLNGISNVAYDFNNNTAWEPFFPSKDQADAAFLETRDSLENKGSQDKVLDSEVLPSFAPKKCLMQLWKGLQKSRTKTVYYDKVRVESFLQPFSNTKDDGLMKRITKYSDNDCS